MPIVWAALGQVCAALPTTTHWSDKVRRPSWWMPSATCCSTATPSVRWSRWRTAWRAREPVADITDVRGTAFRRRTTPEGWFEIDSSEVTSRAA